MKNKKLLVGLAIVAVVVLYSWTSYNGFVGSNEAVDNQWAQVETQYQRRFDLIPNLVESVRGIMKQEQEVFGKLAEARTRYSGATSVNDRVKAANEVETALSRLLVVVENYPQLRSVETVQTLMVQLEGSENRVSVERGRYNEAVRVLNVKVKRFPSNIIAKLFNFDERVYFEAAEGAENAPKVQL
ncbi:MAG: LemA family protein [Candidatus Harrisonbacteria bacterium RIFCSPLOWO2_02_FULL_41_13b]|uniref:LemA family protein n=1 Tax=Candidatus Harrisonbacteria bacterium RIFCSPLOWO2_02_FULL_41_13b TaxID=1798409 RepID=A0A1G1ZWC6_9BACT|nr:MAG: LemA family protein [Candidatus Harrisonbacteria bacterium RIFCSPHIGHO2_02_FULL_40_20]OGY68167.1 MAG: LemA family protein [Candidatus Harrisonbacteria bacterium RIFCSPLOWO2_02_FULL_41_13b]